MEYLRKVDFTRLSQSDVRMQMLLERDSGATTAKISIQKHAPGSASPRGSHTHTFDHNYYFLSGTMTFDIGGTEYVAGPGTLVVIPAGTRHRSWVAADAQEQTICLSVLTPLPGYDETRETSRSFVDPQTGRWVTPTS